MTIQPNSDYFGQVSSRSSALPVIALFCAAAVLAGCGKTERVVTTEERLKAVQTKQETQPNFLVPRKTVDYMADLKTIRETNPKTPEPVAKPEPIIAAKPEPVRAAPVEPAKPAPAAVVAATPVIAAPVIAPAPVAAPAPRPASDTVVVVSREQPNFPREAVRQNVESGVVRARITINTQGEPTLVTIVSARPARIFDREVQLTLQRWKFNPGADGRTYETEINFQR